VDEHLPLLLDRVDDETAVIVMSDHGAGPIDKWLNLNSWLLQEGFLRLESNLPSRLRHLLFRLDWTPTTAYKLASRLRLGLVDRAVDRAKRQASVMRAHPLMRSFLSFADVDWGRTRAYTLGGNITGIWVNLRGREPEGCVAPGPEYERVRDELMERLQELRDPDTGQSVATAIYRREELYEGPYLERAPDVLFETLDEQYTGSGIQEFVSNATMAPSPVFSGCHRRAGMVILSGSPFRQGVHLDERPIVDLAPTILYLLGHDVPQDMDGQVIAEALTTEYREAHAVRVAGKAWQPAQDEAGFSTDEEATVAKRLRDLGYL
jgi:predicted AlkP superfamily phosphohydrolase/phosphomutase